jgi:aspartate/methionine/tyrosine aminotransferase
MALAKPVYVPMEVTDKLDANERWVVNEDKIINSITKKTKFILINTPNNPTGKILSQKELEIISKIAIQYNLVVISDEVYEYIIFDDTKHISIATIDGMWERTITVSSCSKSFSVTGCIFIVNQ